MDVMELRRAALIKSANRCELKIVYGNGLSRTYGTYTYYNQRARTEDIFVPAGTSITITQIGSTFNYAVGGWDAQTKTNTIYSGWNPWTTYTPTTDTLIKLVFQLSASPEGNIPVGSLKGKFRINVGNMVYIS